MKTTQLFLLSFLGFSFITLNAQNVQSNALATSGGLNAGTTTNGSGQNTFYGYYAGVSSSLTNYNTLIGSSIANVNGNQNVIVGAKAGGGNNIGSRNVVIGTSAGTEDDGRGSGNVLIGFSAGFNQYNDNNLVIGNSETSQLIWGDFAANKLKFNAKVGVGFGFGNYPTTAGSISVANYNLFVKGGILTEEVRVSLTGTWADYVFNKDYKLPTLEEVEKQILDKGHLFNVPSAKQIKEDGIELGEMAKIQQEKIEELTLYLIQQNKEIELLKQKNKELEELKILVQTLIAKK